MSLQSCPSSLALNSFYDGEMDAQLAEAVGVHVQACAACREELAELAKLSKQFAGPGADTHLRPIELARLHRSLDTLIAQTPVPPEKMSRRLDHDFRRAALMLSALAASVLIIASVWLWELPGSRNVAAPERLLVQGEPWEVAAITLDPLYGNERITGGNDTRLADAPIVEFMLRRVIGEGTKNATN